MAITDLIDSTTSLSNPQISQANFGTPLILANGDNTASWGTAVIREYSNLTGVAADFAASTGTYQAAAAIFEQDPSVDLICIGLRATSNTTQEFYLDVTAAAEAAPGIVLNFTINGNAVTYTIVSGDSVHDTFIGHIVSAITGAAWYGASGLTVTANTAGGAGAHLVAIACTAAVYNDVIIPPTMIGYLTSYQGQGVAGSGGSSTQTLMTADLNAIVAQNNVWYTIVSPFCSAIEIMAIAYWTNTNSTTNPKTFIVQSSDTNNITIAANSDATLASATPAPSNPPVTATAASVMGLLKNKGYTRTMCIYTQTLLNFTDAAWAGAKLISTPGSEMWAYATLVGVSPANLTETQRNAVVGTLGAPTGGKNGNVYESVAGVNITELGLTAAGQFFDIVRFLDWVNATIQTAIYAAFVAASAANSKIPYTQQGIAFICGLVLGVLKQGVAAGGFASGTLSVPIPAILGISNTNLTARNLPDIAWTAELAGAIQTAQVAGNVTV